MSDTRNVCLTVAYDGTDFRGFAESAGVRTVMGDLRRAVEQVVRSPVELAAAGRTDAGVHGWGQVVSGELPATTDLRRLQRSVNGLCAPDISVRDAAWVDASFSARFSATGRTYRYHVWNDPAPNPLLTRTAWHVPLDVDREAMNDAASSLLGEHDFSSFCRRPKPGPGFDEPSLVRHLHAAALDVGRPRSVGPVAALLRDHRLVVLPSDGAQHRRNARRRRTRSTLGLVGDRDVGGA